MPYLQKVLFDSLLELGIKKFSCIILGYGICIIIFNMFSYFSDILTYKGIIRFEYELKRDFFSSIINMEDIKFGEKKDAEYMSMDNNEITEIGDDYLQPCIDLIRNILGLLIYGYIMLRFIHPVLMLLIVSLSVVAILISDFNGEKLGKALEDFLERLSIYNATLLDLLKGKQLINKFTINSIRDKHKEKLTENAEYRFRYGKTKTKNLAVYQSLIKQSS